MMNYEVIFMIVYPKFFFLLGDLTNSSISHDTTLDWLPYWLFEGIEIAGLLALWNGIDLTKKKEKNFKLKKCLISHSKLKRLDFFVFFYN